MVKGIGIDVVSVKRFERAITKNPRLKNRIFTDREIESSYSIMNLAGKFAAKEAILKSVGTGLSGGLCWHDIEILGGNSPPNIVLNGNAKDMFQNLKFFLSISHEREFVIAVCLATYSNISNHR